jgi:hypothetical protein
MPHLLCYLKNLGLKEIKTEKKEEEEVLEQQRQELKDFMTKRIV